MTGNTQSLAHSSNVQFHILLMQDRIFLIMNVHNGIGVRVNLNLRLVNSHLVDISKQRRQLLQRHVSCVRILEPYHKPADEGEENKYEVELPASIPEVSRQQSLPTCGLSIDLREACRRGLSVHDVAERQHAHRQTIALGSDVCREHLSQVRPFGTCVLSVVCLS